MVDKTQQVAREIHTDYQIGPHLSLKLNCYRIQAWQWFCRWSVAGLPMGDEQRSGHLYIHPDTLPGDHPDPFASMAADLAWSAIWDLETPDESKPHRRRIKA